MLKTSQKLFKKEEKEELRLSPYVTVRMRGSSRMCLSRDDRQQFILLEATDRDTLIRLAEILTEGISGDGLRELLSALGIEDPESWMEFCVRKGVLE